MELQNFKPMSDIECQQANGGFLPLLFAAIVGAVAVPIIKNLWNGIIGEVKLPGGIEAKWNNSSKDSNKDTDKFKKDIEKWEEKMSHLIPPFYEF